MSPKVLTLPEQHRVAVNKRVRDYMASFPSTKFATIEQTLKEAGFTEPVVDAEFIGGRDQQLAITFDNGDTLILPQEQV